MTVIPQGLSPWAAAAAAQASLLQDAMAGYVVRSVWVRTVTVKVCGEHGAMPVILYLRSEAVSIGVLNTMFKINANTMFNLANYFPTISNFTQRVRPPLSDWTKKSPD